MNSPNLDAVMPAPVSGRAGASLGHLWRAFAGFVRNLRTENRAADRNLLESESLAGLDEHMLKDIGASEWLVADAAIRSRDDLHRRIDMGLS